MKLEFNTPNGAIFQGEVTSVTVPGSEERGAFQILPKHAPVISALTSGIVKFTSEGKERRFKIEAGFVEVKQDSVSVLAESALEA